MRVSDFDFLLPDALIALRPQVPREAARLLVVRTGPETQIHDRYIRDFSDYLRPGDALVFNDTKVIRARLNGTRQRGSAIAKIETLLHLRLGPRRWRAFIRPTKKLLPGEEIVFSSNATTLRARLIEKGQGGEVLLEFDASGPELDAMIATLGQLPLPPYIATKRAVDLQDSADYQTIFARNEGAVAAPTAGLHFTEAHLQKIRAKGVTIHMVTLHVGAGTFLPVKVENTDEHEMHAEWGQIDASTAKALNEAREAGGRLIAIGTTSLRLLESAVDTQGKIQAFNGETQIFITPGYRFKAVDALMSNFHLPKSTLFMLVSAFCGLETMQQAYAHAIQSNYRFYSYGDGSLLFRQAEQAINRNRP